MGCRFKVPPSSIQGSTSLSASIIFSLAELNFTQHKHHRSSLGVNTINYPSRSNPPPAAAPPPDHNMRNLRLLLAAAIEPHF